MKLGTITEDKLQFFHAYFNKEFFDNSLSPVIIRIEERETVMDTQFEAETLTKYSPILIVFYKNFDKTNRFDDEELACTILLHEMVHQYCFRNNIDDGGTVDIPHTQAFIRECEKHGLTTKGYQFKEETKSKVLDMLGNIDMVHKKREIYLNNIS